MKKITIGEILPRKKEDQISQTRGTSLKKNIDKSGHCYHVITKTWDRRNAFNRDVGSYRHNLLCKLCEERGIVILFSVTMPNHTHDVFLTPDWKTLSDVFMILNSNVSKFIRNNDKEGRLKGRKRIFDYSPTYVTIKDIVTLLYIGKYVFDNPAFLRKEGKSVPDSCFWMFEKGHFVVPYDEKIYYKLFGLTYDQVYELYRSKSKNEVFEYAKSLLFDWSDEDNRRFFLNEPDS